MSKHTPTPGPWQWIGDELLHYPGPISVARGEVDYDGPIVKVGNPADANLIAAAPAYKLAWEGLSDELRDYCLTELPEWAAESIRKATEGGAA